MAGKQFVLNQSWAQQDDRLPVPAGRTVSDTSQDAAGPSWPPGHAAGSYSILVNTNTEE